MGISKLYPYGIVAITIRGVDSNHNMRMSSFCVVKVNSKVVYRATLLYSLLLFRSDEEI